MIKHYSNDDSKQQSAEQKRRIDTSTMTGVLVSSTLVDNLLLIVGIFLSCFCSSLHSTSSVSPKSNSPKCLPPNAVYSKSIYGFHPPRSPRKNRKQKICAPICHPSKFTTTTHKNLKRMNFLSTPKKDPMTPQG
jgi:hypothetical protein